LGRQPVKGHFLSAAGPDRTGPADGAELGEASAAVRVSDVARLLLEAGLVQYEAGELDVTPKPTDYNLFDD
jgi:hypothetical protein